MPRAEADHDELHRLTNLAFDHRQDLSLSVCAMSCMGRRCTMWRKRKRNNEAHNE